MQKQTKQTTKQKKKPQKTQIIQIESRSQLKCFCHMRKACDGLYFIHKLTGGEVTKNGVHFTLPDKLTSEHTLDDAVLVYSHDRMTYLRLLHPRYLFKKRPRLCLIMSSWYP